MNKKDRQELSHEKIALWGVGDWGVRILSLIDPEYRRRVKTVAVNSDMQSLLFSPVQHKIPIGKKVARGRGTGGERELGEKAFRESESLIRGSLDGSRALLLIGGLGGGVGSGVVPILCQCAGKMNILTLAFVTRPFKFEGGKKAALFKAARDQIQKSPAGLVCFSLDRLVGKIGDDTPCEEAFKYCDLLLKETVECVIAYLTTPAPRGGDYATLESMFSQGEETVLGAHEEADPKKLIAVMKGALSSLSLSAQELSQAKGVLIQIQSGTAVSFSRFRPAITTVAEMLGEEVDLLYTVQQNKCLGEKVKVTILVSGVPGERGKKSDSTVPITMNAKFHPPQQTELDFRKLTRGDFAEVEPTMIEGEDLDIPTFLRKGERLE